MFIGWIRKKSFELDLNKLSETIPIDKSLILKSYEEYSSLCFGAYDESNLVAFISAYKLEKSFLINNFYYKDNTSDDIKKRLLKLLFENINDDKSPILLMAKKEEKNLVSSFNFKDYSKFKKAIYHGGGVAFNFTNATSKSIIHENYMPIISTLDKTAFNEDRVNYIKNTLFKQSSLILSTQHGYQHSYAINKSLIKISPWIMYESAFSDAEKMMRGIIYHRGLKKIFAFIPSDVEEITNLYTSYKFDITEEYTLVYKNSKPKIDIEMLYAF